VLIIFFQPTRHAFKAIVFIFTRNLSELIINLHYGLFGHGAKSYVPVAQGTVYGICSYLFLHYIVKAGQPITRVDLAYEILAEGRHIARSEIVKQIEDDIRKIVEQHTTFLEGLREQHWERGRSS
jgi:hypothetical protein